MSDEDLDDSFTAPKAVTTSGAPVKSGGEALSARQLLQLKRKQKAGAKKMSAQGTEELLYAVKTERKGDIDEEQGDVHMRMGDQTQEWPIQRFCDRLLNLLFDPLWKSRHGAAVGLRAVMRHQFYGLGRGLRGVGEGVDAEQDHRNWVADCLHRLVIVLLLDQFADHSGDVVVAPVRETVAQVIGLVMKFCQDSVLSEETMKLLDEMTRAKGWEIPHGAFLALKYVYSVSIIPNRGECRFAEGKGGRILTRIIFSNSCPNP